MIFKFPPTLISTTIQRRFSSKFDAAAEAVKIDPKSPSFSPLGTPGAFLYKSPYATVFPTRAKTVKNLPIERPFERLIKLRRLIRKNAKGKVMRYDAWVLVGNKNGSAGFAHSQASQAYKAVQSASRRAKNNMKYFELFQNRTLFHDIIVNYRSLRLRLMPKPPGYSVKAQRNIEDFCSAIGINDLAAQVMQGKTNPSTIVRAMFYALENLHKTPDEVAKARGRKVTEIK